MSAAVPAGTVLEWGVRDSFITYVEGLPDGVVEASEGAVRTEGGFVLRGRAESAESFTFDGVLRFFGHHGVLNVELRELRVDRSGDDGELSALISGARYPIAVLTGLAWNEGATLRSAEASFTDDGAAILGGVYPPGATAAPATIRFVD